MADKPQDAVPLSDADLDELVGQAFAEDDDTPPAAAPEAQRSAPAGDPAEKRPAAERPDKPAEGDEEDVAQRQAEGGQAGEVVDPAAATDAPPAAPPGSKPFTYQASKGTHALPGALELADGSVVIAKDAQPQIRQILASAHELRQNFTQLRRDSERKINALEKARVARQEEAEAVYELFTDLKKMSPEERWAFFQKFDEEAPKLELAIEKKKIDTDRAELERQKAGPELTEDEKQEQVQKVAIAELNETFKTLAKHDDAKLFTRDELIEFYRKWARRPTRLMRVADADGDGYTKGQTVFDDTDVFEDFALLASMKKRAGGTAATGAAARNAALNADQRTPNPIPPVIAPARPAGGDGKKQTPSYAGNKKGFKKDFMAGALDDTE